MTWLEGWRGFYPRRFDFQWSQLFGFPMGKTYLEHLHLLFPDIFFSKSKTTTCFLIAYCLAFCSLYETYISEWRRAISYRFHQSFSRSVQYQNVITAKSTGKPLCIFTLPETNSSHLKLGRDPKGNGSSSNHPSFRCENVSSMEGIWLFIIHHVAGQVFFCLQAWRPNGDWATIDASEI